MEQKTTTMTVGVDTLNMMIAPDPWRGVVGVVKDHTEEEAETGATTTGGTITALVPVIGVVGAGVEGILITGPLVGKYLVSSCQSKFENNKCR